MLCYLSLGSNLGPRAAQLVKAIGLLAADDRLRLQRVSPVYETAPVGYADQPHFLNLALSLSTGLTPEALLELTQAIELSLGRERPFANAPRTMDIDLLLCEGAARCTAELALPHPRMLERQFVLAPLADIAPGLSVAEGGPVSELVDSTDRGVRPMGRLRDALRSEV
jgi:2-amino-4-hydroxy-6-hydroxymethyldihydropteridine diphosphokinase